MVSVALVVGGCRESRPQAPKALVADADPLVKAREAMARHEYGVAVGFLREAVARRPADLEPHYRLGVSASHLDEVDEASREFEWVVAHGEAETAEVKVARDWLSSRPSAKGPSTADGPQKSDLASLSGKAIGPDKPVARLQIFLKGVPGTAVEREYHVLRTDQQGNFHFANVVPGEYVLTNAVAGPVRWRLRIPLTAGQRLGLDLSPANDASVRDDFPERG